MQRFPNPPRCGAIASACSLWITLAASAAGQDGRDSNDTNPMGRELTTSERHWEYRGRQAAGWPQLEPLRADAHRERRLRLRVRPRDWIRIAIDINQDGTFDREETIHHDDLQAALEKSRERKREQQMLRVLERLPDARRELLRLCITGEIEDIGTVQIEGQPFVVGRLVTRAGHSLDVRIGPAGRVRDLALREGDRISVLGRPVRIECRTAFVADQVSAVGETVDVREAHRLFDAAYSAEDLRRGRSQTPAKR